MLALRRRLGDEHVAKRLSAEVDRTLRIMGCGRGGLHWENFEPLIKAIALALRATGLSRRARRNALALTVRERTAGVCGLPPEFDGLRLLQLSDLHLDGYPGFGRCIAGAVHGLAFDAAVLTGDFRFYDAGPYESLDVELAALIPALACRYGVYGILGNHDYLQMVPPIERAGVRLLLNEAAALEAGGARLWLVGLDDAHFYGAHDFDKALAGVPPAEARLLLAHSPEVIEEAAARGFCVYLTGHTHAGQICLPGGYAPYVNARCERRYIAGEWREGRMVGYTSAGVGCSGVWGRFFCPPEIVIHTLRAA